MMVINERMAQLCSLGQPRTAVAALCILPGKKRILDFQESSHLRQPARRSQLQAPYDPTIKTAKCSAYVAPMEKTSYSSVHTRGESGVGNSSENTSAVKASMVAAWHYASSGRPALRQVSCRKVSRSQPCSIGT